MTAGCKSTNEQPMAAQAEYSRSEPPVAAEARRRAAARAKPRSCRRDHLRPGADRRHRHHDLSRRLTLGAVVLVRSASGDGSPRRARGHHPGPAAERARHRSGVRARRGDRARHAGRCRACGPTARQIPRGCSSRGSAAGSIDELPVPRLIIVQLATGATPDLRGAAQAAGREVPGATLDDHRGLGRSHAHDGAHHRGDRLACSRWCLPPTVLSVIFATRGAMAANRTIIEVLHFVGAKDGFIAGEFQRHFLLLGLKGGAIGGGAAMVLFALAGVVVGLVRAAAPSETRSRRCSAIFSLGPEGYGAMHRPDRAGRGRDGGDLAAHRLPHPESDGVSALAIGAAVCAMIGRDGRRWRTRSTSAAGAAARPLRCVARAVHVLRRARGVVLRRLRLVRLSRAGRGGRARPQRRRHRGADRRRVAHRRRDRIARRRTRQAPADQRRASRAPVRPRSRASIRATRGWSPAASISTIRRSTPSATRSRRGAGCATAAFPR